MHVVLGDGAAGQRGDVVAEMDDFLAEEGARGRLDAQPRQVQQGGRDELLDHLGGPLHRGAGVEVVDLVDGLVERVAALRSNAPMQLLLKSQNTLWV